MTQSASSLGDLIFRGNKTMAADRDGPNIQNVADYIGDLSSELAQMAEQADCKPLARLLDLAAQEARRVGQSSASESAGEHEGSLH